MTIPKVSVVIVTKNRSLELSHVFGSLLSGSILPDEILVIDNNSIDNTKQLVIGISQKATFPVRYENFSGTGYPTIYNQGLKKAKYDYVAFIDDDCVADTNWLKEIKKILTTNSRVAAVMGWCETYYHRNVYSQATILFDNEWKNRSIIKNRVVDCEVLDNKNVVYNRNFLFKNSLEYDQSRVKYAFGAAEDCDLGMQIQEAGGSVVSNRKMIIWHKDPKDWLWFMKKNISSWNAYDSLKHKWDLSGREKLKKKANSFNELIKSFSKNNSLSSLESLKLFFVAKQVMILNRLLFVFSKLTTLVGINNEK